MKKQGEKRRKNDNTPVYRSIAMITQFGINMLVPIFAMSFLGIFLDRTFETSFWMIVLFFVGALAGGRNVYKMAKQIYDRQDGSSRDGKQEESGKDRQPDEHTQDK